MNRTFHVLKTPVYRFDLYGRHRTLWTDDDDFWWCYLELVYKPNINFGVNRTCHVLKALVYRIDLYGRYRTLWTDDDNFW